MKTHSKLTFLIYSIIALIGSIIANKNGEVSVIMAFALMGILLIFKAIMFAMMFKNTRVFSCYAENIVDAPKKIAFDSNDFDIFWKKKTVENYSWSIPGSYVADSVILLEEIK